MYNQFFGFKEHPFKLVPDPGYLFLSKSHEEALAYLKYALSQEEGFVELIGEVGTGKTMVCRAFLESLGSDTESAYIFNPRMNALELLKSINDEFGISSDHNDTKSLIDALNLFLMDKKSQGKKVILMIDEAQNLSKEVLEQIRLLSNLETTKNKLLQIILVGQPELGDMLDSYELRQLAQRISLRCRLRPLNFSETKKYIEHRIHVACQKPADIFTSAAVRRIYRYSRGIPRLINIACDRALLTAYGFNRRQVTAQIAGASILELSGRREIKPQLILRGSLRLAGLLILCITIAVAVVYKTSIQSFMGEAGHLLKSSKQHEEKKNANPMPAKKKTPEPQAEKSLHETDKSSLIAASEPNQSEVGQLPDVKPQAVDLEQLLLDKSQAASRASALKEILTQWGMDSNIAEELNGIENDQNYFLLASGQHGLILQEIKGNLSVVRKLNLCAVLEFNRPGNHASVYLATVRADNDSMTFLDNNQNSPAIVKNNEILKYWTGRAFVFWKNFYNYQGTIPLDAPGESVIILKLHLRSLGFTDIEINTDYDPPARQAVKTIQAGHGIPADEYVGPLTKIVLYNETSSLPIPHLAKDGVAH